MVVGSSRQNCPGRSELRHAVQELFADDGEVALFYFAGHGYVETTGGYLCTSESHSGNDGVALTDVMSFANQSRFRNKVIILDCCQGGAVGQSQLNRSVAEMSEGLTILTASTAEQYSQEEDGSGVFTSLMVDALSGAASNLVGDVTPGSIYAHVDQSLGPWAQRPIFKTNVQSFVSLRRVQPPIAVAELSRIPEFSRRLATSFNSTPHSSPSEASSPSTCPLFRTIRKSLQSCKNTID
jgi:hypothetical protein